MRSLLSGLLALTIVACSEPEQETLEQPPPCKVDGDCGAGRYCSESGICRRDCYIDAHCYGPTTSAQCNAQGRCIDTIDAAMPPPVDAEPSDGKPPADDAGDEEGGGA
jgi:hypothetical protein